MRSTMSSRATTAERTSSPRSEEHTSELQSRQYLVCRLLLEKKKTKQTTVAPCQDVRRLTGRNPRSAHTCKTRSYPPIYYTKPLIAAANALSLMRCIGHQRRN